MAGSLKRSLDGINKFCLEQVYGGPILTPKYSLNAVNSCNTACFPDQ